MSRQSLTVKELAREANADLDEVLVTLWDLGLDYVLNPTDLVKSEDLRLARRKLGIATRQELRSPDYWCLLLGIERLELDALLVDMGVSMSDTARYLPPGAVRRLKATARSRGIDPLTGVISQSPLAQAPLDRDTEVGHVPPIEPPQDDFEWRTPGHERNLRWLSTDEVRAIHFAVVHDFAESDDPIVPAGVLSEHLLASATYRPQTAIGGTLKYPTVETSAAALLHALVLDHAFCNGNKRTALVSMLVFLDENGLTPICNEAALFKLVLQVAQHRVAKLARTDMADREVQAIAEWLCDRTRVVEKGERPLPWRRLRRILRAFGCDLETAGGVGNRINLRREVTRPRRILGRKRTTLLQTQVFYRGEGSDADITVIKKIREDLQLDEINGVDSFDFYSREPSQVSDFIARYRKTLHRLARL